MFLFLFVFACCTPRGKDERTPATRDILCKVNATTGATTAKAKDRGATIIRTIAVVATNAVPAAERFVCRRMRLGAVFERANPFAFLTYCLRL